MSFFTKNSKRETEERAKFIASRSGEVDEAIKAYKKGKADRDSVRKALQREDSYFDSVG